MWHPPGTQVLEAQVISRLFEHRFLFSKNDMVYPCGSHLETKSLRLNFIKGWFKIKQSQTLSRLSHSPSPLSLSLHSQAPSPLSLSLHSQELRQFSQVCFSSPKPTFEVHFLHTSFGCFSYCVIFSYGFVCVYLTVKCCLYVLFFFFRLGFTES